MPEVSSEALDIVLQLRPRVLPHVRRALQREAKLRQVWAKETIGADSVRSAFPKNGRNELTTRFLIYISQVFSPESFHFGRFYKNFSGNSTQPMDKCKCICPTN